jgi:hypothetical protein
VGRRKSSYVPQGHPVPSVPTAERDDFDRLSLADLQSAADAESEPVASNTAALELAPPIDEPQPASTGGCGLPPAAADPTAERSAAAFLFVVELPDLVPCPRGHIQRAIDIDLSHDQGAAARRLLDTLAERGVKLHNGRRVTSSPDAIRWLLEQLDQQFARFDSRPPEADGANA